MCRVVSVIVILFALLIGSPVAEGIGMTKAPPMHRLSIECKDIKVHYNTIHFLNDTYGLNVMVPTIWQGKITQLSVSHEMTKYINLDHNLMKAKMVCSKISELPEIYIPIDQSGLYHIITIDATRRIGHRVGFMQR